MTTRPIWRIMVDMHRGISLTVARVAATITAVVVAAATFVGPAQAREEVPWGPTIDYPLYRPAGAPADGDAVVQLEAPGQSWGIRRAARLMDERLPGLTIRTSGTCASNPTAACVRVVVGVYDIAQQHEMASAPLLWQGVCICPAAGERVVYLNRWKSSKGVILTRESKATTAAHELGHALGLGHHREAGVTSSGNPVEGGGLSDAEAAVLASWFSVPRFQS